jgi:ComF family protein
LKFNKTTLIHAVEFCLDLIYPPKCVFCGKVMEIGTKYRVCSACKPEAMKLECPPKYFSTRWCDGMAAAWEYKSIVKTSLTRFKFQNKQSYYATFAEEMCRKLREPGGSVSISGIDRIVCVPLHPKKERKRGYNQSLLLACEIARRTGKQLDPDALVKTANTKTQSGISELERYNNVRGAYGTQGRFDKLRVLIVDDVITTGSTLDEIARVLKLAGAAEVTAIALATNKRELTGVFLKNDG